MYYRDSSGDQSWDVATSSIQPGLAVNSRHYYRMAVWWLLWGRGSHSIFFKTNSRIPKTCHVPALAGSFSKGQDQMGHGAWASFLPYSHLSRSGFNGACENMCVEEEFSAAIPFPVSEKSLSVSRAANPSSCHKNHKNPFWKGKLSWSKMRDFFSQGERKSGNDILLVGKVNVLWITSWYLGRRWLHFCERWARPNSTCPGVEQ